MNNLEKEKIFDRYEDFCLAFFMELRDHYHYKLSADQLLNFLRISDHLDLSDEESMCLNMQMFFCHQASETAHFAEIFHAFYCSEQGQMAITQTGKMKKSGVLNRNVFLQKEQNRSLSQGKMTMSLPNFKCERFFAQFELTEGICDYSSFLHAGFLNLYDDYVRYVDDLDEEDRQNVADTLHQELMRFGSYCRRLLSDPSDFIRKSQEVSSFFQAVAHRPEEESEETEVADEEPTPKETTEYLPMDDHRIPISSDYTKKDLRLLTKKDMEEIKRYIRENAHKLRGRVNRNLRKPGQADFDYKRTVKNAFRTGMVPIDLYFKNPKPRRVKMVCFLDISPSCISAATVLIYLLHALETTFVGGVEIFSFTDQAKKITPMVRSHTVTDLIAQITTESKGTVSDYSLALESFTRDHFHEIQKDTIFLFLGDMKNNYRRFNKEHLNKLHTKVANGKGKVILLHTDPKRRWYKDDSILRQAEPFLDEIYEIKNVDDILHFLSVLSL